MANQELNDYIQKARQSGMALMPFYKGKIKCVYIDPPPKGRNRTGSR